MTRTILISVPPTVGHVNHGIALARLAVRAGLRTMLITGTRVGDYLRSATIDGTLASITVRCLPSHDLNADRTDPRRRPHLEEVCDPVRLRAAIADELAAASACDAVAIIGKDSPASVIAAIATGQPYWAYYTDGAESLAAGTNRQTVSNPGLLHQQVASVARDFGVHDLPGVFPGLLRSTQLNIVRGLPETTFDPGASGGLGDETLMFAGALTFDGADDVISTWGRDLAGLSRPVTYVTFGTVLADRGRFAALRAVAARLPGTMVIASDLSELREQPFPANVVIASYIPNEAALRVASVVVHHGGHGTMLAALAHGVPQVAIPDNERTNQAYHGKVLERLGLGAIVSQQDIVEKLDGVLARLMTNEVQTAARSFAVHVRERTDQLCGAIVSRLRLLGGI